VGTPTQRWRAVHAPRPRFTIAGYGTLSGKQLDDASDLDLVFLFEADAADPEADAQETRYTRLGQRLNTWLTSTTAAGPLYDTAIRLRPDGVKGLIASSVRGLIRYQREQAWVWEHQALTRTRSLDNIALLPMAGELGLVPELLAREVADAYRDYHSLQHKVHLTGALHARVKPALHAARRATVEALWTHAFGEAWH
jgi:[glutamine synthetase] adenylyltransferase / [glutamine synthetase]-adenylyl-L-tyrosine phosphorylase